MRSADQCRHFSKSLGSQLSLKVSAYVIYCSCSSNTVPEVRRSFQPPSQPTKWRPCCGLSNGIAAWRRTEMCDNPYTSVELYDGSLWFSLPMPLSHSLQSTGLCVIARAHAVDGHYSPVTRAVGLMSVAGCHRLRTPVCIGLQAYTWSAHFHSRTLTSPNCIVITPKTKPKLGCCTRNCRILCYAFLGNLPQNSPPSFQFFTFPPTLSRRHLPPCVNGVDAPERACTLTSNEGNAHAPNSLLANILSFNSKISTNKYLGDPVTSIPPPDHVSKHQCI